MRLLLAALVGVSALAAQGETYRIRGKEIDESELKSMYSLVATNYVIYRSQLKPVALVRAFPMTVKVTGFLNDYTAVVEPERHVGQPGLPEGVQNVGARAGKEFTSADTNRDVRAGIYKGTTFALSLREKSTSLEFTKSWNVMVVDSNTYVHRENKDQTEDRLRVLYDVTMRFIDFVSMLQRGQTFKELEGLL